MSIGSSSAGESGWDVMLGYVATTLLLNTSQLQSLG